MHDSSPMIRPRTANAGKRRPLLTAPRLVAACAGLVLLAVAVAGRLSWIEAALSMLTVLAATLIIERGFARPVHTAPEREKSDALDPAVAAFADILPEPCIVIDERSVVAYSNRAARTRFPRMREGDPLAFTLRDPDLVEAIVRARETGRPEGVEIHMSVPNETWLRVAAIPFPDADSTRSERLVLTLGDLTEQRRTDRLRADFVANASHELRTPLTSLIGFIETLQGSAARDEAARTRFLAIMRNQSERMSALVDDLLSLSRIEQRQHVRPTARVELNSLLREVAEGMELRARDEDLEIRLELPDQPLMVTGDRQELYEVVENLIDNAIKYGAGGETIEVSLEESVDAARQGHRVMVTDHGPGIPDDHVPRLTERFYRVEPDAGRQRRKGTGLGLAIVKHVVSRHHGQLSIRSKLGEGTRVEVMLPAADPV